MPSEKFRITTNGQSLRNPNNGFFGMTLSANMTLDESDVSAHNDRRSAHNALERQRREHLNVKFQQLAHALPSLQSVRRPSKTMIVAKSLEFVSSSLKRESTFTSEIQKLRLENEKLRKQAEASSNQLKKQLVKQDDKSAIAVTADVDAAPATPCTIAKKSDDNDNISETSTLVVKQEPKPSLKRKASMSGPQLSPPPTPEAMRGNNRHHPVVIAAPVGHQQKKKKMLKQTKSLPVVTPPTTTSASAAISTSASMPIISTPTTVTTTTSAITTSAIPTSAAVSHMSMANHLPVYTPANTTITATAAAVTAATPTVSSSGSVTSMINTPAASLIDSPWSPIDDNHLHSSLLTYPPNHITNTPNNNTHNYFDMTSPSSSNTNMLYDLYADNLHPMLLAPYYIPTEPVTSSAPSSTNLYTNFSPATNTHHHYHQHHHQTQPQQPRHCQPNAHGHDFYLS